MLALLGQIMRGTVAQWLLIISQTMTGTTTGTITNGASTPPATINCTANNGNPYDATTTVSTLTGIINGLNPLGGGVVCLQRGQTWSATAGFNITATWPDSNRVTICAADAGGHNCTDTGAANPVILITNTKVSGCCTGVDARGGRVIGGAGGITFRFIDFTGTDAGTTTDTTAWAIDRSAHDVTFHGGKFSHWMRQVNFDNGGGNGPTNIKLGDCADAVNCWSTCTAQLEITQNVDRGIGNGDDFQTFGACQQCTFSTFVHGMTQHVPRDHIFDSEFAGGGGSKLVNDPSASYDTTFQCNNMPDSTGGGAVMDIAASNRTIVRDNFAGGCFSPWLGMDTHGGPDPVQWGSQILSAYRNEIHDPVGCTSSEPIIDQVGANTDIYDNIVYTGNGNGQHGFVSFWCGDSDASDLIPDHVRIFNNTIFRSGSAPPNTGFSVIGPNGSCGSGAGNPAVLMSHDVSVINNIIIEEDTTPRPMLFTNAMQSCSNYGTNGVQIHHNFDYSSAGTPNPPVCSAADWTAGGATAGDDGGGAPGSITGEFGSSPQLAGDGTAYAGDLATAFTPTSNASRVCGRGDATTDALRSQKDYFGNTCTTHDIGAICCPP